MEHKGIITSIKILEREPDVDGVMGVCGRVIEIRGVEHGEMRYSVEKPRAYVEPEELERLEKMDAGARIFSKWNSRDTLTEPYNWDFHFIMGVENTGLVMDSDALKVSVECIRDARYRVEFKNEKGGGLTTGGKYDTVICSRDKESGLTTYLMKGMANQYAPTKDEDYDYPIRAWFIIDGEGSAGSEKYPIGRFEMDI